MYLNSMHMVYPHVYIKLSQKFYHLLWTFQTPYPSILQVLPHFLSLLPAIHFNKHLQVFFAELCIGIRSWTALGEENKSYCAWASAFNSLFETMQIFMKHKKHCDVIRTSWGNGWGLKNNPAERPPSGVALWQAYRKQTRPWEVLECN